MYLLPSFLLSPNAAWILWKEKIVAFYTNNLAEMPDDLVMRGGHPDTICCIGGLVKLDCFKGDKSHHWTTFKVPAPIVAYNAFMNLVDHMDERQSTNLTMRVEKKLTHTLWTFYLDADINNSYALLYKLKEKTTEKP